MTSKSVATRSGPCPAGSAALSFGPTSGWSTWMSSSSMPSSSRIRSTSLSSSVSKKPSRAVGQPHIVTFGNSSSCAAVGAGLTSANVDSTMVTAIRATTHPRRAPSVMAFTSLLLSLEQAGFPAPMPSTRWAPDGCLTATEVQARTREVGCRRRAMLTSGRSSVGTAGPTDPPVWRLSLSSPASS